MTPRVGVLCVNFGEPASPSLPDVVSFLERIFVRNLGLEHHQDEAGLARARTLAVDRAPGLLEDYEEIGGSPLNAQADAQVEALRALLAEHGMDVRAYSAYQFTEPFIGTALASARADDLDVLVGLPMYPLCGQTTTVAALDDMASALIEQSWDVEFVGVSGWHRHPEYVAMRADHLREFVSTEGLDLDDPETLLYFSAHGTPVKYLDEGSRYDRYVEEYCRDLAARVHAHDFAVGFQNHSNRPIEWTQPDNDPCIAARTERCLVVEAVSFMHEQSETLVELDRDLRDFAASLGKEFHRVPVPHDNPRFTDVMAGLVQAALRAHDGGHTDLDPCRCRSVPGTWCTNGARDLPASPYISKKPASG